MRKSTSLFSFVAHVVEVEVSVAEVVPGVSRLEEVQRDEILEAGSCTLDGRSVEQITPSPPCAGRVPAFLRTA